MKKEDGEDEKPKGCATSKRGERNPGTSKMGVSRRRWRTGELEGEKKGDRKNR